MTFFLQYSSAVVFLKEIDDIFILQLIEKISLNKFNQTIVQIFITHFAVSAGGGAPPRPARLLLPLTPNSGAAAPRRGGAAVGAGGGVGAPPLAPRSPPSMGTVMGGRAPVGAVPRCGAVGRWDGARGLCGLAARSG